MKVYNYNLDGEYLNETEADPDPMVEGSFLIPANATTIKPPIAVEKRARVFKDNTWAYVLDYRGEIVNANDGSNRSVTITGLGIKKEDVVFEPVPEADAIKQVKEDFKSNLTLMLDYMLNPTPEKAAVLAEQYEALIADAG